MSVENGVPELQRHSLHRNGDDPIGEVRAERRWGTGLGPLRHQILGFC